MKSLKGCLTITMPERLVFRNITAEVVVAVTEGRLNFGPWE